MESKRKVELFFGEVVIKNGKMYTKIHKYQDNNDHTVILAGDSHIGTEKYKKELVKALASCDIVLFENFGSGNGQDEQVFSSDELKSLSTEDIDNAMLLSIQTLFLHAESLPGLVQIGKYEMAQQLGESWAPTDMAFTEESAEKIMEDLSLKLSKISPSQKQKIIEFSIKKINRMENGIFQPEELGEVFIFLYGQDGISEIMYDTMLCRGRNEYLISELKEIITTQPDKRTIGVIYGSAHVPGIRALLEEKLGFKRVASRKIKAM